MIVKRNGRYGVRVYLGGGRYRWLGTFATRTAAAQAERAALTTAGERLMPSMACDTYAKLWLTRHPRPKASTNRHNEFQVRPFARDFAGKALMDVDRVTARSWALAHPPNYPVVRAMFNDAIDDGLLRTNPFANLRLTRPRGRRDLVALTVEELDDLTRAAEVALGAFGRTFRAMILFSAYTGVRPGELFALEHQDVQGDEVHVRRNLDATGAVTSPKNGRDRRVVIPAPARDALLDLPRNLRAPWVFTTSTGLRFSKSSHYYYWNPVRAAFGRPGMDYYELRHFCATHLLERGMSPADVAVQLGHTDGGALVMSTYGHPAEDAARARLKAAFESSVTPLSRGLRDASETHADKEASA